MEKFDVTYRATLTVTAKIKVYAMDTDDAERQAQELIDQDRVGHLSWDMSVVPGREQQFDWEEEDLEVEIDDIEPA